MQRDTLENPINVLTTAGFAEPQAQVLARTFSAGGPFGRRGRIKLLDAGLDAAFTTRRWTIGAGWRRKIAIPVDPSKAAALCRYVSYMGDAGTRRWLLGKLRHIDWNERLPLLSAFLYDPEPSIQALADQYLATISPATHEVLKPYVVDALSVATSRAPLVMRRSYGRGPGIGGTKTPPSNRTVPSSGGGQGGGAGAGPPGEPPDGPSSDFPPEQEGKGSATLKRFTHVDLRPAEAEPAGDLIFALRVIAESANARAVDVRVPEGQDYATVLVFASSSTFAVASPVRAIKVPKSGDSEDAVFHIDGANVRSGRGEVSLLIYDEFRLIGSLTVPIACVASEGRIRMALGEGGAELSRDPANAARLDARGLTLQASIRQTDQHIVFHVHRPPDKPSEPPRLVEIGASAERFDSTTNQQGLAALRSAVDKVEQGLSKPEMLGASNVDEALQYLAMNLDGYGLKISDDILSVEVRTLLTQLPEGTAVQWVVADQTLDAIPWELARDPVTRRAVNERIVLMRVPAPRPSSAEGPLDLRTSVHPPQSPPQFVYVLGENVYEGQDFEPVRKSVKSATGHHVVTNFANNVRTPVTAVGFQKLVEHAAVIYVLCHGIVDQVTGLHLEIESKPLGWLLPVGVRALKFTQRPLVFVNACSSSTATWSVGGFTTFGWSFLQAGAGVFIGALAPVPTNLAVQFAELFFDAHLGRGMSVHAAVFEARKKLATGSDPSWILYTVYGDLSAI